MTAALLFRRKTGEAWEETHPRPGFLSDFILGSQDGIVNVLGVLLAVAVAAMVRSTQPMAIILAAGLGATFAESISMGAVAYTSTQARRDHYVSEVARERREMEQVPHLERKEVRQVFETWGFEGGQLEQVTDHIVSNPKAWLEFMMAHELGLAPVDAGQARKSALLVGSAAIVGSLIPLAPFVVFGNDVIMGMMWSVIVAAITLFVIGWYKAKATIGRPFRSGTQMLVIGIASAIAGGAIAILVGWTG